MIRILSLGAGVQSTTLALMSAAGDFERPDCAIFADTGDERLATYLHLRALTGCELMEVVGEDGKPRTVARPGSYQGGPLPFVAHVAAAYAGGLGKPSIKRTLGDEILASARGTGKAGSHSRPPFYTLAADGSKGMIRRQCTGDFKIDVIQAQERALLGLRKRQPWPRAELLEQWIAMSTDEATRAKPVMARRIRDGKPVRVPHPTIRARWPLLELGMSRTACERWLTDHGHAIPPKSACTFCPYHSDAEWRAIRDEDPAAWERVTAIDDAIRAGLVSKHLSGALFLHPSRVPLRVVNLDAPAERQANLFENECEGMCGS